MARINFDCLEPLRVRQWVIEDIGIRDELCVAVTEILFGFAGQTAIGCATVTQLTLFPRRSRSIWIAAWEQRKFSDVVDVCSGKDYKHLKEGSIPVYGTGGFMTSVDEALSYDRDAVGIGRKGTIDKPYLLKAPFWTVDTLFYAIPKPDMDLEFVHCSFLNVDWKSKDESTGLPSLSKEAINETIALVPSFNEQSRIGEFFNDLDFLITLHQRTCPIFCFCAHGSRTNFASALQG